MHFEEKCGKGTWCSYKVSFHLASLVVISRKLHFQGRTCFYNAKNTHDFPLVILNISALVKTSPFGIGKKFNHAFCGLIPNCTPNPGA